jgi:hypothetical protein
MTATPASAQDMAVQAKEGDFNGGVEYESRKKG